MCCVREPRIERRGRREAQIGLGGRALDVHTIVVVSVEIIAVDFAFFFNGCIGQKLLENSMRASIDCNFFNEHRYNYLLLFFCYYIYSLMSKPTTSYEYISEILEIYISTQE